MSDKTCTGSLTQRAWFKHKAGQVWHGAIKKVAKCFSLSVVAMTSSCGQQCGQALLPHAHHHDRCCRKGDDSSDNGHSCSSGSNGVAMAANVVMGSADDVLCVNCQRHRKNPCGCCSKCRLHCSYWCCRRRGQRGCARNGGTDTGTIRDDGLSKTSFWK